MRMHSPALAAITLERSGGGVALVAELLWEVMQQEFGRDASLISLLPNGRVRPSFADKLRFGAKIAAAQLSGSADWLMFSHLALAKAHDRVPQRMRRPYGIFLHGIEAWCPLTAQEQRLLRDAELRVANSAYTARRVMQAHPEIGPVIPCPLALPRRLSQVARGSVARRSPANTVIIVGRMSSAERYKGHDQLIEAWPAVLGCIPDASLLIVGTGDDRPRLERLAIDKGLAGAVRFTGFVDEATLDCLLDEAAVFALPSRGEGFGLAYLEAMAHRLPCIGSVHDAAGDVIADGITGRLVDQADVPALADAVVQLLGDSAMRQRMGDAGYDRLTGEFTFERFAAQFGAVLRGHEATPVGVMA